MSLLASAPLGAQAVTVPASSGLYERLEAISAFFPVRGVFLGERSLSARQMSTFATRLDVAVDAAPASARKEWAARELRVIGAALGALRDEGTSSRRPLLRGAWRADVSGTDAITERVASNGQGSIDAFTNPFEARRDGWRLEKGAAAAFAPTGAIVAAAYAAAVQPRFSSYVSAGRKERVWQGTLHRAYLRGRYRNVALAVGAEEMLWGQSPIGALFISGNAPAPPAIALSTDTAFVLPWWFRFAGPVRGTLIVADLGGKQVPPHAKLAAWQVSIMPWSRFELGVAVLVQTGGSGGPKASFLERVVDLFPVIDALAPQHADLQISNKLAGGNLRWRFPELSGLDLYYELAIDDFDGRRLRSSMVDDAAHLLGARLPVLTSAGLFAFRAEWHKTSLRIYEHGQFQSGITYQSHIIGSPLGPHAAAGYFAASWSSAPGASVELLLADERRDPAQYANIFTGPRDTGFQFVRLTDDPDVRRARALLRVERALGAGAVRLAMGHNIAWRPGQPKRTEWLGQLTFGSAFLPTF